MQESLTEKEEMRQQQRVKIITDMTRKIKAQSSMGANNSRWASESLAADCKQHGSTQNGRTHCGDGAIGCVK